MEPASRTHRCTVVQGDATVAFDVRDGGRLLHEMIAHHATAISVGCRGEGAACAGSGCSTAATPPSA
jgi:hypothetical protein